LSHDSIADVQPILEGLVPRSIRLDRIVYATITLMSVLIIYDGWQHLRLLDVIGIIIGPVIAMFVAHVFSALIARQVEVGRPLTSGDLRTTTRSEARFLFVGVPPVGIVSVLFAIGVTLTHAIQVTLWFGVVSLGFW
jgi:hypothetical protein